MSDGTATYPTMLWSYKAAGSNSQRNDLLKIKAQMLDCYFICLDMC
uniref:Uncharacterized protein n=1 Tax=Arundo donax TaxID=35708 RepID=A0A0A8YT47_ARUDO